MIDYVTLRKLGYKEFRFVDQREIVSRAIAQGWTGQEPSVLGTYSADKAVEEAAKFLVDYLEGK